MSSLRDFILLCIFYNHNSVPTGLLGVANRLVTGFAGSLRGRRRGKGLSAIQCVRVQMYSFPRVCLRTIRLRQVHCQFSLSIDMKSISLRRKGRSFGLVEFLHTSGTQTLGGMPWVLIEQPARYSREFTHLQNLAGCPEGAKSKCTSNHHALQSTI
jgi:hypothetical protein